MWPEIQFYYNVITAFVMLLVGKKQQLRRQQTKVTNSLFRINLKRLWKRVTG
jgi:hypothetical protein